MRIAIITFHRAYNCGAMLQAWALKTILEHMGHHVEFPFGSYNDLGRLPWKSSFRLRARTGTLGHRIRSFVFRLLHTVQGKGEGVRAGKYYDAFRSRNLPERHCLISEFSKYYDIIVLGSDQVINPKIHGWTSYFLCEDIPAEIPKIAYAASIGDNGLSQADASMVKGALRSFRAVSTREPLWGYPVALDPVLLLAASDYGSVCIPSRKRDFIYMYSCEATDWEVQVAKEIAAQLKLELIITPTWGRSGRANRRDFVDLISPGHMIGYIRAAKYVLAGSFHGTALALLHGKPFLNVVPDHRPTRRVSAILETVGEADRIVNPENSVDDMVARLTRPLDDGCNARIAEVRRTSLEWLRKAIDEAGN